MGAGPCRHGHLLGSELDLRQGGGVEIGQFLDSAQIPGASAAKVPLFSAAALAGDWSQSSSEFANYVTRGGAYAGDATISTGLYLHLRADGLYRIP